MLYHPPRTSPGHLFHDMLAHEVWQNPTGCSSLTFSVEENWRAGGMTQIIFAGVDSLTGMKARNHQKSGFNNDAYHRMDIYNETL